MKVEEIENAFLNRGVIRGGILLLRASNAIALVEMAREKNVRILGVDGFRLGSDSTQPLIGHSIDISSAGLDDSWTGAIQFLRQQEGDLFFEIVIAG